MLNRKSLIFGALLASGSFAGCSGGAGHESDAAAPASVAAAADPGPAPPLQPAAFQHRDIARTGSLSLRVANVEREEKAVAQIVAQAGGYVESSETSNLDESTPRIRMKLKVPSARFEATMAQLENLGHRLHKQTSTEDVTGQLIDYRARLKTMLAQEDAFRNMLRKSGESQAALDLQTRIMRLREEIESIQGQHKALAGRAALSSIELTLHNDAKPLIQEDPNWFRGSWTGATNTLAAVGKGLGRIAIFSVVFAPIWVPLAWVGTQVMRRTKRSTPAVR